MLIINYENIIMRTFANNENINMIIFDNNSINTSIR